MHAVLRQSGAPEASCARSGRPGVPSRGGPSASALSTSAGPPCVLARGWAPATAAGAPSASQSGVPARAGGAAGPPATAHFRAGGEEECTRTGDTNPGCNYLVRGFSPSMHFFRRGDRPHLSPPLHFGGAERGSHACGAAAGPAATA